MSFSASFSSSRDTYFDDENVFFGVIALEMVRIKLNRTIKPLFYFQGTVALYTMSSAEQKETSKY